MGEYSYYDDPEGPEQFETKCVLYHFPFIGDKLLIGKFCALARGVKFIMNGANHQISGFSTYPFYKFGNGWEAVTPPHSGFPYKGDTVIGNDVWIGYDVLVMYRRIRSLVETRSKSLSSGFRTRLVASFWPLSGGNGRCARSPGPSVPLSEQILPP